MPSYNKLVRDRIPEVIKSKGKTCRTRILNSQEYIEQLNIKLSEEVEEYRQSKDDASSFEELADIVEIIKALVEAKGSSWEKLEAIRSRKANARGEFKTRVYLIDVDDA